MKELSSLNVKDKPLKQKKDLGKNVYLPVFTFFVTMFLVLAAFTMNDMIPLGRYSMLVSDLKGQYAPNIIRYKHHLQQLDFSNFFSSFSYDTTVGAGKNFMSTFGYYLASPFNILAFFFPDQYIGYVITVICALRLSFGSTFMCIYLQKRSTNKDSSWPMVFAITYAFSSFAIIFLFNILWFDAYMMLPLLLYCIERFIEKDKKLGIALILMFLFISNFYASYMVGVFSFFYLVARLVYIGYIENNITLKAAAVKVVKFILIAICSILAVGAFLVPVAMDVLMNRDITTDTAEGNQLTFKGVEILDQIFYGNVGKFDTLIGNLPYIFISLSVTLLIAMFFVSKVFEAKVKYYYGAILVLIYVSFNITVLDKMWQAFDTPNWFHHRYAFVFLPMFLVLSLRTFEKIKDIQNKEILKALAILLGILLVTQSFGKISEKGEYFLMNICLMTVYAFIFMALKREKWPEQLKNMQKISAGLLAVFILFETAGMGPKSSDELSAYANGMLDEGYRRDIVEIDELTPYISTYNNGTRMAKESLGKHNKDLWIRDAYEVESLTGLNGISVFDSCCNRNFSRFIKQFGYQLNFNYAAYDYSYTAPYTDAFLSIGNVVTTQKYTDGTLVSADDADHYYRSYQLNNTLPLGFAVDKNAPNYSFYMLERMTYGKDYFDFQNRWYRSMFPKNFTQDVWVGRYLVTDDDITVYNAVKLPFDQIDSGIKGQLNHGDPLGEEPETKVNESRNAYFRMSDTAPTVITIEHKATHSGEQYICFGASSLMSNTHVYVDNVEVMSVVPNSYYSIILRLGYYEEGQNIKVTLTSTDTCFSYQDIYMAAIDQNAFDTQFETLDLDKVKVDKYDNGIAEFTTNLEDREILLTTIPYEKGWTCYVDGKETEIITYQDALIAVDPGTGTHKVELKYMAPGIYPGLAVSAVGIVALVAYIAISGKKGKQKTETK